MKILQVSLGVAIVVAGLVFVGRTQAAPAQVTAAPARKLDYPAQGKTITMVVPFGTGGGNDIAARLLASELERGLGVPVQVVNRPGANTQVGMTAVALAKPDGYTLGFTSIPSAITVYLDPTRKAVYTRKDFTIVAQTTSDPSVLVVKADGPYKTTKDLVNAAKASPEKIKIAAGGILNVTHIAVLQLEKLAGVKFATVMFDSGAAQLTAVLGGHVDATCTQLPDTLSQFKSGAVRVLGIMDQQESKFFPGVKTMENQGMKANVASGRNVVVPAGTPREIVEFLSASIKKAMESDQSKRKMDDLAMTPRYLDSARAEANWIDVETQVLPFMSGAK